MTLDKLGKYSENVQSKYKTKISVRLAGEEPVVVTHLLLIL